LGLLTGQARYLDEATRLGRVLAKEVDRAPQAHTHLLSGLDHALGPSGQTVICGDARSEETRLMLSALNKPFLPSNAVVFLRADAEDAVLADIVPGTRNKKCIEGKPTAYVCQNYSCKAPTTEINEMLSALQVRAKQLEKLRQKTVTQV
jgi:uncharacterized protein YyaL (SSP411 family)